MERNNEMNVVFMAVDTISILQSTDQGGITTFKSYYLRNTFYQRLKLYAIGPDFSDAPGQSNQVH